MQGEEITGTICQCSRCLSKEKNKDFNQPGKHVKVENWEKFTKHYWKTNTGALKYSTKDVSLLFRYPCMYKNSN